MSEPLEQKIKELESELQIKEQTLAQFRNELKTANLKIEQLIANMSHDIKVVARLQKALVPTEFPHIQGFEFSTKFVPSSISGGDYLDIFEHQDRLKFSVIMSSSSGYAMSALLLSALIGLPSLVDGKKAKLPHVVLKTLVDEIGELFGEKDKADLFYAIVNRRTLELTFNLTGEIYAFYMPYGGDLVALEQTNEALSKSLNSKVLKSNSVKLNAKDKLIICSRGIVEAQDFKNNIFGKERLIKTLMSGPDTGVHDIRNEILFQVQKFTKGSSPSRDQSVVVFEVKEKVLKLAT